MPRISLQSLLAGVFTIAVIFSALFNNASQLPPHQDWKSITCSADGKWLFAGASENGYLIDLETNQVASKFKIYGGMYSDIKTVAFIDNETIIAIDTQRRVAPRIVWISIPENKITKKFPIPAHTQAAVSRKYFYSVPTMGASFDIRDARTSKLVMSWAGPGNSSLAFSHDGNLLIRSNNMSTPAHSCSPVLVIDIQSGKQVASYPNWLQCLIKNDPTDPILISGLNTAHFRDKEYPGYYYHCARYSVDGTQFYTGAVIIDSETGEVLVDLEPFRAKFSSPNALSANNQKLFVANQGFDRGISVYDISSFEHLYDIYVSRSRWQVAGFGFLLMMVVAAVWVFILSRQRRRDATHGLVEAPTSPAKPNRSSNRMETDGDRRFSPLGLQCDSPSQHRIYIGMEERLTIFVTRLHQCHACY